MRKEKSNDSDDSANLSCATKRKQYIERMENAAQQALASGDVAVLKNELGYDYNIINGRLVQHTPPAELALNPPCFIASCTIKRKAESVYNCIS